MDECALGLPIDFSESVTTYVPGREKVWRTIGTPRLVIIDAYEMRVLVEPLSATSSRLTISLTDTLLPAWARLRRWRERSRDEPRIRSRRPLSRRRRDNSPAHGSHAVACGPRARV
jgi:hypothetical protein